MKKYFDMLELLPIAIFGLCFISENDMVKRTQNNV